ncbi:MAG TPA: MATE family efflux transporter [bacterium]|jgi:putative MATE family efflux protein
MSRNDKNDVPETILDVPRRSVGFGPPTKAEVKRRGLDLTGGPILKTVLLLAVPVIASNFLNIAINMADLKMVGYIGTDTQAGIILSNNLLMILFALGWGTSFATITLVAQHSGANREQEAKVSAAHSLLFALILGVLMILIGNIFIPKLILFYNADPVVNEHAISYLKIIFDYLPFYFLLFIGTAVMQGRGDTVSPLIIMLVVNLLNIFLNYCLIFGNFGFPEMGIRGAAVGSVVGRGIGAAIIIAMLMSGKYLLTLKPSDFSPRWIEFWKLLRLGIPNSGQAVMRNFNVMILYRILSLTAVKTVAQTSLGVGFTSEAFGFLPLIGLSIANGTMVGQNLGAGLPDRAEEAAWTAWKTALALMVIPCIVFLVAPQVIVRFFSQDEAVIASVTWYLRINAVVQLFQSGFVLTGALRGAGDALRPLYIHILGQWIIRLPLAYLLSTYTSLDEKGVWTAMAISSIIECCVYIFLFRTGYWKKIRVN